MSDIVQMSFDYSVLSPEQAQRTQDAEYRLIGRTQKTIIENGRDLLAVKEDIGHGHFLDWIKSLGIDERTAQRWMSVADNFGEIRPGDVFEKHALYLLSSPKSPESARQEAKERAEAGEKITEETARQIRDAHKAREQAEQKALEAETQLSLFQESTQAEQERLAQRINALQSEMETLITPERVEVPVIPDETKKRLQEMEQEVKTLTQQKANLAKLNEELSADLDATEEKREQEAREDRIRQEWRKVADGMHKSVVKFLGQLPVPIDTQVFEEEDWSRLDQVVTIFQRAIVTCRELHSKPSLMVIEAD